MKVFHGYRDVKDKLKDPIVAIGMFDGIHLGHKKVIKRVLNYPSKGSDKVVMTFDPHPQKVLHPEKTPPRIMSLEHRLHIFEKMGLDAVIVIKFTDFIAMMSPEEFIKRVIKGIGAKKIYVGDNFHFGRAKSGDTGDFKGLGKKHGIDVCTIEPVKMGNRVVSSTWLRQLVRSGKIARAEKLLRRPVSVLGTVVKGDARGRELGYPTANIDPHQEVIPPAGVYAVKIEIDGKLHDGVLNVGYRPTFYGGKLNKRKEPHIEVHVISYQGDLYSKSMEIFFIKKLRRERRFRGESALIRQIDRDVQKACKLLQSKDIVRKIKKYKYL